MSAMRRDPTALALAGLASKPWASSWGYAQKTTRPEDRVA